MHSSAGIFGATPASAMSALEKAIISPETFLLMQGISTSPATGSQTRPSWFTIEIAQASPHCEGVPPMSSTSAAAAIPEALPHSAWQPPWAPATLAFCAITMPMAPAVNMDMTTSRSAKPRSSYRDTRHPGRMPQLPAVGAATIRPMEALQPATASALEMARVIKGPQSPPSVRSA